MTKILLLALTLLVPAAWLQSQATFQAGTAGSAHRTVQGCLQGSDGNYTITEKSGRTYSILGDMSKLTAHIGHEVQITGTSGPGAIGSGIGSDATGIDQPVLTVGQVRHISGACQTLGGECKNVVQLVRASHFRYAAQEACREVDGGSLLNIASRC